MGQDYIPLGNNSSKEDRYKYVISAIKDRNLEDSHPISNITNVLSYLRAQFNWFWVGYYLNYQDKYLMLGPFQGTPACTKIFKGQGVCGTAWKEQMTVIIKNVNEIQNHIACSSVSKSEIVVPIKDKKNQIIGVLDIDSSQIGTFDEVDKKYLQQLIGFLSQNEQWEWIKAL